VPEQVVGVWRADDGGQLTFSDDGRVRLDGVDIGCLEQGNLVGRRMTTQGRWQIPEREYGVDPRTVLLTVEDFARSEGALLFVDHNYLLCVVGDPDAADGVEYLRVSG
jgi:hypothetical protein